MEELRVTYQIQSTGEGILFGWGTASPTAVGRKNKWGKFTDRVVGSLVSLTYSYFKIIPLLKLLSREDILSVSLL